MASFHSPMLWARSSPLSDEAGAVGAEYTYQPFGATAGPAGPDPNPYRFTGREVDDTGLHFHRARYYHPALQRFIAENPIGFAGARANLYAYAQNNPLSLTDPLGVDVDPADSSRSPPWRWPHGTRSGTRRAASGLRIAGLADADAALLERVIGAWASPEQAAGPRRPSPHQRCGARELHARGRARVPVMDGRAGRGPIS